MAFTHLQVKSGYSLMKSTLTIDKLVNRAKQLGFQTLALTDEHVLFGAVSFYTACRQAGIKPIIGMTVHIAADEEDSTSCVLLAKNNEGWQSLLKLSTELEVSKRQAISREELRAYTNEVVCIFPASSPWFDRLLQSETFDKINVYLKPWKQLVAAGDFYIGIRPGDYQWDETLKGFQELYDVPIAAFCDVRYLDDEDTVAYDCLQAMRRGSKWNRQSMRKDIEGDYLRSEEDMKHAFSTWPEVLQETEKISRKCSVTFDFTKRLLPSYPLPEDKQAHTYLEELCLGNLRKKYQPVTEEIMNRLNYELQVIREMGFSDYFLIVADFIHYAKSKQIMVGPGRGSSASSIVAYLLGITDVDPVKYNLLFERFLNPERQTMPDIDVDFSDERRHEVIDYLRDKYGKEHVSQIITFDTFSARSLIRELIKTMDVPQPEAKMILKYIPHQAKTSIPSIVRETPDLRQYIVESNERKLLFMIAAKLEGIPRHISTHAAGVVIAEEPLTAYVPLTMGQTDMYLTQFPMDDLESLGLLKIDLLGLRNLTIMEKIIRSIQFKENKLITPNSIPDGDKDTFRLLQEGRTNGIFQLESSGMKNVLTRLKPSSFEDVVAVNALYRPGPMDFIPSYIARKHQREEISYPHPDLKPILEDTYGVLIYQEQIMQIASRIAGFTLGEADILRRAVSKKKQDTMDNQRQAFIKGCIKNGYDQQVAQEIFSWIVRFSNYGFPRSHAVAYSKLSYQLSFLKAHFPAHFFAEILSSVRNQDVKRQYIHELNETGLAFLPPSINKSFGRYAVEKDGVRMGFASIKGVGNQAIKEIIRVRKSGRFRHLFDFCMRVSLKAVNRHTIENLILAGAFDEVYNNRASLLATIDPALEKAELFGEFSDQTSFFMEEGHSHEAYVKMEDFSQFNKLAYEKELLGIYVSSHPLSGYRVRLQHNGYISFREANQYTGRRNIKSAAVVHGLKKIRTKRGESMAFLDLGDENANMQGVVFPDLYRNVSRWLEEGMLVLINGKIEWRNDQLQWVITDIRPFNEELEDQEAILFIQLTNQKEAEALSLLKEAAEKFPGKTPIIIYNAKKKQSYRLAASFSVDAMDACIRFFHTYFGNENVVLQK